MLSRFILAGALLTVASGAQFARAQSAPPDEPGLRGGEAALPSASPADALPDLDAPRATETPRPRRRPRGELPPLRPYPKAQRLGLRGGADAAAAVVPAPTIAALPTPPPRRVIRREDNPFAPVGLFVGDLKLTPYVEQSLGYASNPFGTPGHAKGSGLSDTEVGVALQSNWSRNELTGSAKLGYNEYFQTPGASAPYGSGVVDYRVDASRNLTFDTEGRYNVGTQTNAQLGLGGLPTNQLTLVSTYGATAGVIDKFGDLSVGLHGSVDREQYQGGDLSLDNYTDYGLKLRTGYRLTEAMQPFVELGGDARVYDSTVDIGGYNRNSNGVAGLAGLRISLAETLTGEVAAGYGAREYHDPRLPEASAPLFDASLIWTPTALTTVTLKAVSGLNDSLVTGASAQINRAYTINLDQSLTERVKLGLSAGLMTDTYVGVNQTDKTYTLGATAEYHLSRYVVLKASATHLQYVSSLPGSNYTADTVLVGVRLQR